MAISIVLQDERGNRIGKIVHDTQGAIALSVPEPTDDSFSCVRFIDPYGDTVFNPLQASAMIEEWDRLKSAFAKHNAEPLWSELRELIVRCSEEPHTYLRFVGD